MRQGAIKVLRRGGGIAQTVSAEGREEVMFGVPTCRQVLLEDEEVGQ